MTLVMMSCLLLAGGRGVAGNDFISVNAPNQQLAEQALAGWGAVLADRASKKLKNPQHPIIFHWVDNKGNNLFILYKTGILRKRHIVWVECPPEKLADFIKAAVVAIVQEENR